MIHPVTYINKILVVGKNCVQLYNFITKKLLYTFNYFENDEITTVQDSPVIDIIAFATKSGKIHFINIKQD